MTITSSRSDFDTSIRKALADIDPDYGTLPGLVVTGTHQFERVEEKLVLIRQVREHKTPFLGICAGLQLMIIEFCRNVLNISDATSEELGAGTHVIEKMPELRVGIHPVYWREGLTSFESHWHQYRVADSILPLLRQHFWISQTLGVVEIAHLPTNVHPHFIGVQFHPEYESSKEHPHLMLQKFIQECRRV